MCNLVTVRDEIELDSILKGMKKKNIFNLLLSDPSFTVEVCKKRGGGLLLLDKQVISNLSGRSSMGEIFSEITIRQWANFVLKHGDGKIRSKKIPRELYYFLSKSSSRIQVEIKKMLTMKFSSLSTDSLYRYSKIIDSHKIWRINIILKERSEKLVKTKRIRIKKKISNIEKEKRNQRKREFLKKDKIEYFETGYSIEKNEIIRFIYDHQIKSLKELYRVNRYLHSFFVKTRLSKKIESVINELLLMGTWGCDSVKGRSREIKYCLRSKANFLLEEIVAQGGTDSLISDCLNKYEHTFKDSKSVCLVRVYLKLNLGSLDKECVERLTCHSWREEFEKRLKMCLQRDAFYWEFINTITLIKTCV